VLLPVFEEDGEVRLILTRRPETMPSHRGEVAFPGGKIEPEIDRDAEAAALREAQEEIGLRPELVDVIAQLPVIGTAVGTFSITPFVGMIDRRPELTPDPREVARLFDVALVDFLAEGVYHEERWDFGDGGSERSMPFYDLEGETIWGATARVLTGFLGRILGVEASGNWEEAHRADALASGAQDRSNPPPGS
jgi:8-oxo-dGTP pyrophosphatase MutT (NUDIX family)